MSNIVVMARTIDDELLVKQFNQGNKSAFDRIVEEHSTDIAKQNLEEALLWHARLGRNIRSIQPPDVTVIGAE